MLPPPPLFYTLFWKAACSSDNITRPVRQLLELTATSEDSNNYEKVFYNSEHIRVSFGFCLSQVCCCHSLVFLVATSCPSISFELSMYLGHLPTELLSSAITRVLPGSLRLSLFKLLSDKLSLSPPIRQILNQITTEMHSSPPALHFSHS